MHQRDGKEIRVVVPPSGLVTALEPVLNACDGTWIAHGSGDADREVVDGHDRIPVPPNDPRYTLRRLWLSKEEEEGYYYGFANEGMWPLCHIAHTRPIFRASDWACYQRVNQKFADAVLSEMLGSANPIVLIQDYHFALAPRMIKDARPDARVAIFWHIPWPNPEAFGICPWQAELLDGLLGADLIGFRAKHPVFTRRRFFEGEPIFRGWLSDIGWFRPDGAEMTDEDWKTGYAKSLAVFLNGDALPDPDQRGRRTRGRQSRAARSP